MLEGKKEANAKMLVSAVFWVCFTQLTQLSASSTSTEVSLDEGRILVSWTCDEEAGKLSFTVNATTVGWIGFGFARLAPNKMQDYDLILAGYKEGHGYIYDMYSIGQSPPPLDSSQDYHLVMATEEEGHTFLHFQRAANTGDAKDIQFTDDAEVFFVWALHSSFDASNSSVYPFHERKGSSEFKQLIQTGGASITQSMESEAIPDSATLDPVCTLPSADDCELKQKPPHRRASDTNFISVSQIDRNQEKVEEIHYSTGKDLLAHSSKSNSGLDKIKLGSKNEEKTSKKTQWIYFSLSLLCMFLGGLTAIYMGYFICWKMKVYKIKCGTANLPSDALIQCEEQIKQLRDQINALSASTERNALLDELELKEKIGRITQEIAEVENHTFIHRQDDIRMLNYEISAMKDSKDKSLLFQKLQAVAHLGLKEDLTQMMSPRELQIEALNLVQSHITDVAELANYLNQNARATEVIERAGLTNVKRRLGPDIEVLCALVAKRVDISKEWVRNLLKKAPTFHKLTRLRFNELKDCCQGAETGEINDVYQIILQHINGHGERRPADLPDETVVEENGKKKAADKQDLTEAQTLLEEAKKLAGKNQSELSRKIAEIAKLLNLPDEWLSQQETGEQLLERLSQMIRDCSSALEAAEEYENEVEVITKASGGRALCGIYHAGYGTSQPAECQLLKVPTTVNFASPDRRNDFRCISFCKEGLATNYVEKLTKLSCRTNLCASGYNGMISVNVDGGLQTGRKVVDRVGTVNTTASTLYFFRHNKKSFRFERGDLRLSSACTEDALRIVQNAEDISSDLQEYARDFLRRYGSHFPLGIQTLGGIFFTIADVETQSKTDEKTLQKFAKNHLEAKMSIHFLSKIGIGAGGNFSRIATDRVQHTEENITATFSYRKMSMGPPANPATFHKLLSYNSNWALIDRGDLETASIPVWELVKDLGGVFEDAAIVLKETWAKDEQERKSHWDERKKIRQDEYDMERAKEELELIKETHLREEHHYITDGVFPTNTDKPFYDKKMRRTKAYEKAIKLILKNPRKNFCQIKRSWGGYTLKCWKNSALKDPKFESGNGECVLLFSKTFFIWERNIPGHE